MERMPERMPFDDLISEVALLRQKIAELKPIVKDKLTIPEGYEPDVTIDAQQVAKYLHCNVNNVYKKASSGTLPHYPGVLAKLYFSKRKRLMKPQGLSLINESFSNKHLIPWTK